MDKVSGRRLSAIVILLAVVVSVAWAEERTWTDAKGKFNISAELVRVDGDKAVLRKADGKEIKVQVEKLSDADQAFIKAQGESNSSTGAVAADPALADIATRFFGDLRTEERALARQSLTKKAEGLISGGGKSPLLGLPQPQQGAAAIKVGGAKVEGEVAEIPVAVRAGGAVHKTKLHLRKEGDQWRVFAISAMYPDGEKSINFEAAQLQQNVDPLQAILGKPFELAGYTTAGKKLDMSQYQGKVVLVDFWATWCGPCRAEIPNIRENWDKHHEAGFDVIAVSVDEDMKALAAFVGEEKPPWTVVADNHPSNRTSMGGKYGIRAIPAFVLIGKDGKVAAINCRGPRLGQELGKLLASK